jgi:hypothetical protein
MYSTYKLNGEARSRNHNCRGKAKSRPMQYSERVSVVLVIQHEKRMRPIILLSAACLAVTYFYTLSYKRHDFRENVFEHKMSLLSFSKNI